MRHMIVTRRIRNTALRFHAVDRRFLCYRLFSPLSIEREPSPYHPFPKIAVAKQGGFGDQVAMIQSFLLQFPGPLTLHVRRSKLSMLFAGSASFVVIGAVMLVQHGTNVMMWFSVVFFALCSVLFAINLLPGASSLTLDADGFRVISFYFVRKSRWKDVTNIYSCLRAASRAYEVRSIQRCSMERLEAFAMGDREAGLQCSVAGNLRHIGRRLSGTHGAMGRQGNGASLNLVSVFTF